MMTQNGTDMMGDCDPRVEDYLNDRIQTAHDLQNLDDILQNLQEQHDLQKRQVGVFTSQPFCGLITVLMG